MGLRFLKPVPLAESIVQREFKLNLHRSDPKQHNSDDFWNLSALNRNIKILYHSIFNIFPCFIFSFDVFFLVATDTCMRWWSEKGIVFYGKLWIRILLQILIIDFLLFLVMPEFCARKLSYKIQPF